jgi:hypothetical protein
MKMTRKSFLRILAIMVLVFGVLVVPVFAISISQLRIIASDGTFLGHLGNEYDSNSVYNKYGKGSPYNSSGIMNKYSNYGSDYSNLSPFNRYANDPPGLYDGQGGFYGALSINRYARGVTDQSYRLALQLKALRDSL